MGSYIFYLKINGSDSRLYNHTGDTIHAFTHDGRGIRIRTDAARSPSIAMYFCYGLIVICPN